MDIGTCIQNYEQQFAKVMHSPFIQQSPSWVKAIPCAAWQGSYAHEGDAKPVDYYVSHPDTLGPFSQYLTLFSGVEQSAVSWAVVGRRIYMTRYGDKERKYEVNSEGVKLPRLSHPFVTALMLPEGSSDWLRRVALLHDGIEDHMLHGALVYNCFGGNKPLAYDEMMATFNGLLTGSYAQGFSAILPPIFFHLGISGNDKEAMLQITKRHDRGYREYISGIDSLELMMLKLIDRNQHTHAPEYSNPTGESIEDLQHDYVTRIFKDALKSTAALLSARRFLFEGEGPCKDHFFSCYASTWMNVNRNMNHIMRLLQSFDDLPLTIGRESGTLRSFLERSDAILLHGAQHGLFDQYDQGNPSRMMLYPETFEMKNFSLSLSHFYQFLENRSRLTEHQHPVWNAFLMGRFSSVLAVIARRALGFSGFFGSELRIHPQEGDAYELSTMGEEVPELMWRGVEGF